MRIERFKLSHFKALQDVHFQELPLYCGFIGPNGSGKSPSFKIFVSGLRIFAQKG